MLLLCIYMLVSNYRRTELVSLTVSVSMLQLLFCFAFIIVVLRILMKLMGLKYNPASPPS